MRILIAPDKFKGSLSAQEVAENMALGIRDVIQTAEIEIAPMADGGEGTVDVICNARGGKWVTCSVHGPLGDPIEASYVWLGESAVMEMSEAAGIRRLKSAVRDVMCANTFGVGEMLLDAAKRDAREIIIGLGGSATNDGGFGMARSLGFRFLGENEDEITNVARLVELARIQKPIVGALVPSAQSKERRLAQTPLQRAKVIAAVDVKNPLLGQNGATDVRPPKRGIAGSN